MPKPEDSEVTGSVVRWKDMKNRGKAWQNDRIYRYKQKRKKNVNFCNKNNANLSRK